MALHKFTLQANTSDLENKISALATECLSSKVFDMPPDVAMNGQELKVKFRRSSTDETVLSEALGMFLATTQELLEHFRYLRSSPSKAAALISPQSDENSEQTKKLVLSQMKSEWELVLRLEGNPASACELHEHCREMTAAVKRSGQSDVGSLPNLMAVAIRGLHRRLCIGDDSPQALSLEKEDWMERDPIEEMQFFWMPEVIFAKMLFRFEGTFFLSCGRTPGILNALKLKELPFSFKGPLPAREVDETNIPLDAAVMADPLSMNQSTHALTLDVGRNFVQKLLLRPDEVRFFDYSIHLAEPSLSDKCGTSLILRRGMKDLSLMGWLVTSGDILKLTVKNLMDFMDSRGTRMPKNTTKAQRIRKILSMDDIQQECGENVLNAILKKLEQQEEKRRKKDETGAEQAKEEGEIHWEELEEDAATAACRQLLGQQDEKEQDAPDDDDVTGETPANGASRDERGAPPDARASRALLSNTCALPPELVEKLPLPDGTMMHMVIHKDRTLPHFQGKLCNGAIFEGKNSCAASYNPELPPHGYDSRKKTLKGIAPQKRNRDQAYWIVYSWLTNATTSQRGRASKRKRTG
ncbi:unnamed protein product [Symbiodinium sp. CCMP2592]|nr:unnamed protein product [Symbiodinium sp. CCMP2592]CAE7689085.1 unnamed protein product [Symbiodinium sp. CCMP2592]